MPPAKQTLRTPAKLREVCVRKLRACVTASKEMSGMFAAILAQGALLHQNDLAKSR